MLKKLKTIKNKQKTNLKELSDLREELLKFQEDLVEIQEIRKEQIYTPVPGDEIDAMMADFMNTAGPIDIVIKRINCGYYQFGSKFVNIKNNKGKMAVQAGGGYTSVEEYI